MRGADVRLWLPETLSDDLSAQIESSCESIDVRDRVRHRANLTRWWVLSTFGGMWADVDVVPLRAFDERWNASPWCAALDVPTPFVCGGPAGHDLWQRVLDESLQPAASTSPLASGGRALARVELGELRRLPAGWFAERDAVARLLPEPPGGRFSDHRWSTSRRRRLEGLTWTS